LYKSSILKDFCLFGLLKFLHLKEEGISSMRLLAAFKIVGLYREERYEGIRAICF